MSESNEADINSLSEREILERIYVSQLRVETMVSQAFSEIQPTIEAFSKGGLMGLMGRMGR